MFAAWALLLGCVVASTFAGVGGGAEARKCKAAGSAAVCAGMCPTSIGRSPPGVRKLSQTLSACIWMKLSTWVPTHPMSLVLTPSQDSINQLCP